MGRQKYLEMVDGLRKKFLILGLAFTVGSLLVIVISILAGMSPGFVVIAFFTLILGIIFLIATGQYKGGENSKYVKVKGGDILAMADDLYKTTVYEDDYIIVSEKAIGSKKSISKISAREDVLGIYEQITKSNHITVSHTINMMLRDGRMLQFNVFAKKKDVKEDLLLNLAHYCPNAMVGYTGEMLQYVRQERKAYKQMLKAQKK